MSAQQSDAPAAPAEKKGVSKLVDRVKRALLKSVPSKRLSLRLSRPPAGVSTTETSTPAPAPSSTAPGSPTTALTTPAPGIALPSTAAAPSPPAPEPGSVPAGGKIYEFITPTVAEGERVEKPIRVRIHRTCHLCGTTYGSSKICTSCEHPRCELCPRQPPKKDKPPKQEDGKKKEKGAKKPKGFKGYALKVPAAESTPSVPPLRGDVTLDLTGEEGKWRYQVTKPARKQGQELVRKKPMQRVRRFCHECKELYRPGNKVCEKCGHVRCSECPRDPPKRTKYPHGYAHDAPGASDARYTCHNCNTIFPQNSTKCICGHDKCSECARAPDTGAGVGVAGLDSETDDPGASVVDGNAAAVSKTQTEAETPSAAVLAAQGAMAG